MCGVSPRNGSVSNKATLLLQNPLGLDVLGTPNDVVQSVHSLFGVNTSNLSMYVDRKKITVSDNLNNLQKKCIFISSKNDYEDSVKGLPFAR